MKRFFISMLFVVLSQPALAADATMSAVQQYLYDESGYAPPSSGQAQPAPAPSAQIASEVPYSTAGSSTVYHQSAVDDESYMESVGLR